METFRGLVILPLTAGAPVWSHRRKYGYDGSTSTFVILMFVLSFVMVFVRILSDSHEDNDKRKTTIVMGFLSINIISGFVACIIISFVSKRRGLHTIAKVRERPLRIKEVFLWLFGLPSIGYCGLKLVHLIYCHCWSCEVWYYISTIIFMVSEIIFIVYFSPFKFKSSILTNFSLLAFIAGNLSVWFHSVLLDEKSNRLNETYEIPVQNISDSNKCFSMKLLIEKIHPFLSPIFLEYSLLSIAFVRGILANTDRNSDEAENSARFDQTDMQERTKTVNENTPVRKKVPLIIYIVLLVILVNGLICFLGILLQIKYNHGNWRINTVNLISEIFLKLAMLALILCCFGCLGDKYKSNSFYRPLQYSDYVFLLMAFGNIVMHLFELLGSIFLPETLSLIRNIITVCQDYLQITFLLHADRCVGKQDQRRKTCIKWICSFLVVLNFECWLQDSFLLYQFPKARLQKSILDSRVLDYHLIADILIPMSVYYRFICTFTFYTIGQKLSEI